MTRDEALDEALDLFHELLRQHLARELRHMLDRGASEQQCMAHLERRCVELCKSAPATYRKLKYAVLYGASLQ